MTRIEKLQQKLVTYFPLITFILVFVIWLNYYRIGYPSFNKSNAVLIFSSVIQGMSALMSVAIAVIIFRIQSLENRSQSLEESTLDFIFRTTGLTYPKWIPSVEGDIRSGSVTERYYRIRVSALGLEVKGRNEIVKEYAEDKRIQQKRLDETLNLHTRIEQTIQRIRNDVITSVIFLVLPVLFSFLFLMVSDAYDVSFNFIFVSIVILMSTLGITGLIKTVLDSTVK